MLCTIKQNHNNSNKNYSDDLFHTVAIMRFSQSAYSQSESISPLLVSLVLDTTSGATTQEIVAQIANGVQAGDTATGNNIIGSHIEVLRSRVRL